jgi:hypothetical protein
MLVKERTSRGYIMDVCEICGTRTARDDVFTVCRDCGIIVCLPHAYNIRERGDGLRDACTCEWCVADAEEIDAELDDLFVDEASEDVQDVEF